MNVIVFQEVNGLTDNNEEDEEINVRKLRFLDFNLMLQELDSIVIFPGIDSSPIKSDSLDVSSIPNHSSSYSLETQISCNLITSSTKNDCYWVSRSQLKAC